ncbi:MULTISPECIES: stress protein [unclassified Bacillus cereus group]|uniref:stress protein n=1 Tax=unclassified Bacillus cereus group TaxID=2750818 RepID=UPI001F562EE7|nr:stress protein [Bacillus cereus group sp. BfR-BA-01379]
MKKLRRLSNIALAGTISLGGVIAFTSTNASAAEVSKPKYNISTEPQFSNKVENEKSVKSFGANLNVNVDVLGIANMIRDSINSSANRAGFVKGVKESAFYGAGQQYNVMVFNLNQGYNYNLQGVKFFATTVYDGITYGIWVFESGKFTNEGDGGYINWAFMGWGNRTGNTVWFYNPFSM